MGKLGFELEILADYRFDEIKKGERIFADETTLPTLASGSGSTKTAWLGRMPGMIDHAEAVGRRW
ncbi:hypothetical protein KGO5_04722 [Sinorhizobium sp. KGO-5]|nr:hypothetical protein KGO5_04722 [Sinorhizobium sp. KGO-5]